MKISTLAVAVTLAAAAASAESPFRVGASLPELTLPEISGGAPVSLADFRGEKLMLHVWASW